MSKIERGDAQDYAQMPLIRWRMMFERERSRGAPRLIAVAADATLLFYDAITLDISLRLPRARRV